MLGKTFKGMTDEMLQWQTDRLLGIETRRDETTVYVRPEVVVEVAFDELFRSRRYDSKLAFRFARVLRYRPDKTADQADTLTTARAIKDGTVRARVGAAQKSVTNPTLRVSHADRILFPDSGITKGDVVAYYGRIGDKMLPHVRGRPLTLVRHPKGIAEKASFKRTLQNTIPKI